MKFEKLSRLIVALLGALLVLSSATPLALGASDSAENSLTLDEDLRGVIDSDELEKLIEERDLGEIIDEDKLKEVVDSEKVAELIRQRKLSDLKDSRDVIELIEDEKLERLMDEEELKEFGELLTGEDFESLSSIIEPGEFSNEELGSFVKDDKVADLVAHLKFRDLERMLDRRPLEDSDLFQILDDELVAEVIDHNNVEDVLQILEGEKFRDVVRQDRIRHLGEILDTGDLDRLTDNEEIAEALDSSEVGAEVDGEELYNVIKDMKVGKIRDILDKEDVERFIDFEKVLNLADDSDSVHVYGIVKDEPIGGVIKSSDREDIEELLSDSDIGELLKRENFNIGSSIGNPDRDLEKLRDIMTDKGIGEIFADRKISEIGRFLQNEDADDFRRIIGGRKIQDVVDEDTVTRFVEERDIFEMLEMVDEEELDEVLKDNVSNEELAEIVELSELEDVIDDEELGRIIEDESLGDLRDLLDDESIGEAIDKEVLAELIDKRELGSFLREKMIEDLIDSRGGSFDRDHRDSFEDSLDHSDRFNDGNDHDDSDSFGEGFDDNTKTHCYYGQGEAFRDYRGYSDQQYLEGEGGFPDDHGGDYNYPDNFDGSRDLTGECVTVEDEQRRIHRNRGGSTGRSDRSSTRGSENSMSAELKKVKITRVTTPERVEKDGSFPVKIEVASRGSDRSVTVYTAINGDSKVSKSVYIESGESRTVNLNLDSDGSESSDITLDIRAQSGGLEDRVSTDIGAVSLDAFMEIVPKRTDSGENVLVKGQVADTDTGEGFETTANIYIDGEKSGEVTTSPSGRFKTHISVDEAGDHRISVKNSYFTTSRSLKVRPVVEIEEIDVPSRVKAGQSFEVCGTILAKGIEDVETLLYMNSNQTQSRDIIVDGSMKDICFPVTIYRTGETNISMKAGNNGVISEEGRRIKVDHSLNLSSGRNLVETGNWSIIEVNISNLLERDREFKVFLEDLEEGKANDTVKDVSISAGGKKKVGFDVKTTEPGRYTITVRAKEGKYSRSEIVNIVSRHSESITARTLDWVKKRARSVTDSELASDTQSMGERIYRTIANNKMLAAVVLGIIAVGLVVKKSRDILAHPDTLDTYRM